MLLAWGSRVPESEESRGAKLVDVGPSAGVKVEGDTVALLVSGFGVDQDGGVIPSNLCATNTLWCSTVKVLEDKAVYGLNTMVDPYWEDIHEESVLFCWGEAKLAAGAKE